MAVYIFQHGTTLYLPVVCVKPIYWKVSEMSGPLPDARREWFKVVNHSIAKTHQMRDRMEMATLIVEISDGERWQYKCPVKSMGLSKLRRISKLLGVDDKSFHVDTITDGDESNSLTWDPGWNATGSPGGGAQFEVINVYEYNGASGPFCMPTVWPVACRTTCWGPTQGDPNFFWATGG